ALSELKKELVERLAELPEEDILSGVCAANLCFLG
ncbi:unnamed protein product, partial [marine sediment metagenome]